MSQFSGLYLITIWIVESYAVTNNEMWDTNLYRLWNDRLGRPGHDMMIRISKNSHGHPLFRVKIKWDNNPTRRKVLVLVLLKAILAL